MRVALATCAELPEPDVDEPLLVSALRAAGAEVDVLAWDDASADFASRDLVVVRSTWNYYARVDDFVAWAERTGRQTRVRNAPGVIAWNAKKTYLRELEARGVAIVPTEFVSRGAPCDVAELLARRGWASLVIKPVVSAGSFRTARFTASQADEAQRFLDALTADRDAMVQEWMPAVESYGERSLVFVDGELTHAIRKEPRFAGGDEHVSGEAVPITDDERAFAARVLDASGAPDLLYARVDTIRDGETLRLMELELVEPSLFFAQSPEALARFVRAILTQ
jgi:glutathione synthase/RimK-type ligase-like ATP-grasp enzyme